MGRKQEEEMNKEVSKSMIASLPSDKLRGAKNFINDLLEYRQTTKLQGTYINSVRDALEYNNNGRIYVQYNLEGAVTGRLSNSGYTAKIDNKEQKMGVSFHTLPRETKYNIRDYVVAPEGWDFITADVKAMELRVLAHLAQEKNMIKAFNDRVDLHYYSAAMTFNKPVEKISKEERQIAKAVSFLIVYGGKAETLARKQGIPFKRADKIVNAWMAAYPSIPKYMKRVHEFIEENGYAYTIFGRRRNLPNIRSSASFIREQAQRQGLNFTVQSAASDTILCSIIGITERFHQAGLKAKIIATVHDSVELICPKEELQEVLKLLYKEMTEYTYVRRNFGINFSVPIEIEVMVGRSFGSGEEVDLTSL